MQYATFCPFRMRTGDSPSGPPPVGSTVVLVAERVLTGTDGKRRSARKLGYMTLFEVLKKVRLTFFENTRKVWHTFNVVSRHVWADSNIFHVLDLFT